MQPGGQNFQPESLSELSRFVQYMFHGFEKRLDKLVDKFDQMEVVSKEEHQEDIARLRDELNDVKTDIQNYRTRQTAQARWIIGSLVLPLIGVILTVYSLMQGSAP